MRIFRAITSLLLLTFLSTPVVAQMSAVDSSRSSWLKPHLQYLPSELHNDSDIKKIDQVVQGFAEHRIIAFGEPTHGDGTAFIYRQMITEALLQEKGNVMLALEGVGLFQPVESLKNGTSARMWTGSKQARTGLLNLLSKKDSTSFLLSGFDVQHGDSDSQFSMTEDALQQINIKNEHFPLVREILQNKFQNPFSPVGKDTMNTVLKESAKLINQLSRSGHDEAAQFLKNARSNALVPYKRSMKPRDRQMADNVLYLSDQYPHFSHILWGAGSHLVRSLPAIDNLNPDWSYDGALSMGEPLAESKESEYYTIGFTAFSGTYGAEQIGLERQEIPDPETGSLEQLVCTSDFSGAAFLDLSKLSKREHGKWLNSPLLARPLGYEFMRASWPLAFDGLIIIREMEPSEPVGTDE
ncbi:MAG: erythromycin esterase family protein [Balneolaceae bacterium]|nr:erythromycin esterase family protein [Balneolaceae bacterium]MDR9409671.1 erythromycin esterase family protein [Balneolaceae bacterium]